MSSRLDEHGIEPWDDADLPLDLKRAFGAYGELGPDAASREALLATLVNATPVVPTAPRPWLHMVLLALLGALWWTTRAAEPSGLSAATTSAPEETPTAASAPRPPSLAKLAPAANAPGFEAQRASSEPPVERLPTDKPSPLGRASVKRPASLVATQGSATERELALLVRAEHVMASDAGLHSR